MKEKIQKIAQLKKKGMGLRLKFTFLISLLVVIIVLIVAIPISLFMVQTQQKALAEKLYEKVDIVLGGVVRQAKTYIFEKNTLAINETLQEQYALLGEEVGQFASITGTFFRNPLTGRLTPPAPRNWMCRAWNTSGRISIRKLGKKPKPARTRGSNRR